MTFLTVFKIYVGLVVGIALYPVLERAVTEFRAAQRRRNILARVRAIRDQAEQYERAVMLGKVYEHRVHLARRDRAERVTIKQLLNDAEDAWRIKRIITRHPSLVNATRLWNLIDHRDNPDPLWDALMEAYPVAFRRPGDPNSIVFAYPGESTNLRESMCNHGRW